MAAITLKRTMQVRPPPGKSYCRACRRWRNQYLFPQVAAPSGKVYRSDNCRDCNLKFSGVDIDKVRRK